MTPNHTPGAPAPGAAILHAWSAPVFAARDIPPPDPVLGPVLARGAIALLTGPRGVGKSWLALAMAHAAARGGTLAGWRARRAQRVVYVDTTSGEALLHARLAALAPAAQPPGLVLVPGDAQAQGLPDLAAAAGRDALDRLVTDADLVVLDGLSTLVRLGRGVGARWAALADWLRSLRRRGIAVLLVETSEPRAIAALADTVLRLERPADAAAGDGVRFTVRVAAARALAEDSCRAFELTMALGSGGAAWTRRDDFDRRALAAWRLSERDYSSREIARVLDVSPATAWRLVERGAALPEHLRLCEELPELEAERRREAALDRAAARRAAARRARLEELAALQAAERVAQEEAAARTDPHPPPSPASGRRGPSHGALEMTEESPRRDASEPSPACGRGQGEGGAAAAMPEGEGDQTANSGEAVKQPPDTIDAVATDDLVPVLLSRRRWWKLEQAPPPDWLAKFDYQTLFHAARARLSARGLNKLMLADDRLPYPQRLPSVFSAINTDCRPRT